MSKKDGTRTLLAMVASTLGVTMRAHGAQAAAMGYAEDHPVGERQRLLFLADNMLGQAADGWDEVTRCLRQEDLTFAWEKDGPLAQLAQMNAAEFHARALLDRAMSFDRGPLKREAFAQAQRAWSEAAVLCARLGGASELELDGLRQPPVVQACPDDVEQEDSGDCDCLSKDGACAGRGHRCVYQEPVPFVSGGGQPLDGLGAAMDRYMVQEPDGSLRQKTVAEQDAVGTCSDSGVEGEGTPEAISGTFQEQGEGEPVLTPPPAPNLDRCVSCSNGVLDSRLGGMCGDYAFGACPPVKGEGEGEGEPTAGEILGQAIIDAAQRSESEGDDAAKWAQLMAVPEHRRQEYPAELFQQQFEDESRSAQFPPPDAYEAELEMPQRVFPGGGLLLGHAGSPRKFQIGDVLVCPVGTANPYTCADRVTCGDARVEALRAFAAGTPPDGLELWYGPSCGGAHVIDADQVDWTGLR